MSWNFTVGQRDPGAGEVVYDSATSELKVFWQSREKTDMTEFLSSIVDGQVLHIGGMDFTVASWTSSGTVFTFAGTAAGTPASERRAELRADAPPPVAPTAATLTGWFDPDYGFVRLVATDVPIGYSIFRDSPRGPRGYRHKIPGVEYTESGHNATPDDPLIVADTIAPLGATVTYSVRVTADSPARSTVKVETLRDVAFVRHLFYPTLALKVRVVSFNDDSPSRLTTYAISGQRQRMATWDVRGGREAELVIAVEGKDERDLLDDILAEGAPVTFGMCSGLGNDPGIWAVADVSYRRYGKKDRWLATLPLTEVDMPRILAVLPQGEIPGDTYDDKAQTIAGGTYDEAARHWRTYADAMTT